MKVQPVATAAEAVPLATSEPHAATKSSRERLKRFQTEITNRLVQNDLRGARHKLRKMIANRSVRLHCLVVANRKLPTPERLAFDDLAGLIGAVCPMSRRASPQGFSLSKPDGSRRPVFKFGLEDRACALLIREALKPFARAHPKTACHPAQVLLSGGLPAACDHVRQALDAAPPGSVFVQIDAKRFFPSIACEGLAAMTGLPPEVIHRHLSVRHMDVRGRRSLEHTLSRYDQRSETPASTEAGREMEDVALSGIATGSAAASLVAEMVMGHILRDAGSLPGLVALIVYSDNIGAVVRTPEEALAVQAAVLVAFNRSKAGPLFASKVSIKDVAKGFNFLGYRWIKHGLIISAEPSRLRHERWQVQFGNDVLFALSADDLTTFDRLRVRAHQYARSKSMWAGQDAWLTMWNAKLCDYQAIVEKRLAGERHH